MPKCSRLHVYIYAYSEARVHNNHTWMVPNLYILPRAATTDSPTPLLAPLLHTQSIVQCMVLIGGEPERAPFKSYEKNGIMFVINLMSSTCSALPTHVHALILATCTLTLIYSKAKARPLNACIS